MDRPEPPSYLLEARYLAETHLTRGDTADIFFDNAGDLFAPKGA